VKNISTHLKKLEGHETITLQDDEYFVMGDNRDNSYDSRSFGPVKKELIVGRVWFRGLPLDKLGLVEGAQYTVN
jgi:signal peptidase I